MFSTGLFSIWDFYYLIILQNAGHPPKHHPSLPGHMPPGYKFHCPASQQLRIDTEETGTELEIVLTDEVGMEVESLCLIPNTHVLTIQIKPMRRLQNGRSPGWKEKQRGSNNLPSHPLQKHHDGNMLQMSFTWQVGK